MFNYHVRLKVIQNVITKLPYFCWVFLFFMHLLCTLGTTWQQQTEVPATFPGPSKKEKHRKIRERHKTKKERKRKKEKVINLNTDF